MSPSDFDIFNHHFVTRAKKIDDKSSFLTVCYFNNNKYAERHKLDERLKTWTLWKDGLKFLEFVFLNGELIRMNTFKISHNTIVDYDFQIVVKFYDITKTSCNPHREYDNFSLFTVYDGKLVEIMSLDRYVDRLI